MNFVWNAVFILQFRIWVSSEQVVLDEKPDKNQWTWQPYIPASPSAVIGWVTKRNAQNRPRYETCGFNPPSQPNNWLRSDRIIITEANRVDVTVEYNIQPCSGSFCTENIDLYVNQSDTPLNAPNYPNPLTNVETYKKVGFINDDTGAILKETIPLTINKQYILLAFHDQGGCKSLRSVKVTYNFCPEQTLMKNLVSLPRTVAPANDSEMFQVNGSCMENTVPLPGSLLVRCQSDGEWNASGVEGKCVCKEGMENIEGTCKDCPDGEFNMNKGMNCSLCPDNSESTNDKKSCSCKDKYYRAPEESITENCTAVPSAPKHATTSFVNQSTVVLQWSPPDDNGGRNDVYYDVECRKPCEEDDVRDCVDIPCRDDVIYIPDNKRLNATKVTVKNLLSFVNYTFNIYVKNGVSEMAVGKTFTSFNVKTNGSVPGIPEVSVDWITESLVARVSWALQLKNGVIKEYHVTHTKEDDSPDGQSTTTEETSVDIEELDTGKIYNFEVFAVNQFGQGPPGVKTFKVPKGATDTVYIVMIATSVIGTLLLIILVVIAVRYLLRKRFFLNNGQRPRNKNPRFSDPRESFQDKKSAAVEMETVAGKQNDAFYMEIDEAASFEIGRDKLEFQKLLGKGSFGEVFKAVLEREIVAVKCLKETATPKDRQDMLTELNVMKKLEPHPHVVKLIGCCSCNGPLLIVLEYLPYGDLLGYLRKSRGHEDNYNTGEKAPTSKLNATDLLSFAWMIADGMKYLAKMQVVHRDLAARNVLVGESKVCKISDFGLARDVNTEIYVRQSKARLPVKWMPPESLFRGESSTMSDVWSYAILLWEIFTIGDSPYPGIKANRVASLLQTGYRMPQPIHISEELFAIMSECWSEKPEDRPTFQWLSTAVKRLLKDKKTYVNLDAYKDEDYVNFDMFDGQK